jgi:hypothetical protein
MAKHAPSSPVFTLLQATSVSVQTSGVLNLLVPTCPLVMPKEIVFAFSRGEYIYKVLRFEILCITSGDIQSKEFMFLQGLK